ncbi:MAG: hypothetical protein AABZ08_01210 [Planctomycetota bacterium]
MNKTWQHLPGVLVVAVLAIPSVLCAQDSLAEALKKKTLSSQDRATLEAEVGQRVKRTFGGTGGVILSDARDRLVKPTKEKDVTKEGVAAYAEILAGELETHCTSEDLNTAMAAVIVLDELESAPTAGALVAATKNKHSAVRYSAVRGLLNLRAKIKDDETACRMVLAALGEAGAKEKDEHVLRRIYQAINFKDVATDFKSMDFAAVALNSIMATRNAELAGGNHDEYRDEDAIAAAVGCYAGASDRQKAALVGNLHAFLAHTVDHYFDPGTTTEALGTIAKLAQRFEKGLTDMMKASKVSPPGNPIADMLKGSGADRQKAEKDVRAGLEELRKTLRGDPWRLP